MYDLLNSLSDIDDLIASGQRESEVLEYKTASVKLAGDALNEVAKDVSAFANSSGGTLIYGVATDKADATLPIARDAIDPKNIAVIERVIASSIRPPIAGLRTKALPATGHPECFLIDVPASVVTPHQVVTLQKYYHRNGPHSDPMAHDLVELHFGRRLGPRLTPTVVGLYHPEDRVAPPAKGVFILQVDIANEGRRLARDIQVWLHETNKLPSQMQQVGDVDGRDTRVRADGTREFRRIPKDLVLHPEQSERMLTVRATLHEKHAENPNLPVFDLTVFAADMRRVKRNYFLQHFSEHGPQFRWEDVD